MKRINLDSTFYKASKDDEMLRAAFVEMGFKPMQDDKTYLSVGRIITLRKALANINMSLDEANRFLKEKKMEVELYE